MSAPKLFDSGSDAVRRISLVRLSGELARSLAGVGRFQVEGEVHRPQSGYGGRTYFVLKDRAAQLSVMCPPARASRCRTVAGERVAVTGQLQWVNERGQVLLVADEVVPVGEGAVAAAIAEARARLTAEGIVDRPRRRIPRLPAVVGVVCGNDAAVRADIESVVAQRFPGYPVAFLEVTVSGPGAVDSIIGAVGSLDARPEVEVIVLARGGGDSTQLLPFSDEGLCRALVAARTPIVSAIGHEGDRPLCDEVADLRCGTPSIAAAAVIPSRVELEAELAALAARAGAAVGERVAAGRRRAEAIDRERALDAAVRSGIQRLQRSGRELALLHPAASTGAARARLERVAWQAPLPAALNRSRAGLDAARRQLDALSPQAVLDRGYAVVRTPAGAVVRDATSLAAGEPVDIQLASGAVGARVEEVRP